MPEGPGRPPGPSTFPSSGRAAAPAREEGRGKAATACGGAARCTPPTTTTHPRAGRPRASQPPRPPRRGGGLPPEARPGRTSAGNAPRIPPGVFPPLGPFPRRRAAATLYLGRAAPARGKERPRTAAGHRRRPRGLSGRGRARKGAGAGAGGGGACPRRRGSAHRPLRWRGGAGF